MDAHKYANETNPHFANLQEIKLIFWMWEGIHVWRLLFIWISGYFVWQFVHRQWFSMALEFLIDSVALPAVAWFFMTMSNFLDIRKKVAERMKTLLWYKRDICVEYANFLKIIRKDTKTSQSDTKTIVSVMEIIRKAYGDLNEARSDMYQLAKWRWFAHVFALPITYESEMDAMVAYERNEFETLMKEFTGSVQDWIALHSKELQEKAGVVENPPWKRTLDARGDKIHTQIENLKEITDTLRLFADSKKYDVETNPHLGKLQKLELNMRLNESKSAEGLVIYLGSFLLLTFLSFSFWSFSPTILFIWTIILICAIIFWPYKHFQFSRKKIANRLNILLGYKRDIHAEYANLLVIVRKDAITPWTDPETIVSAMEAIRKISEDLKKTQSVLHSISSQKKFSYIFKLPNAFESGIDDIVSYERNEFVTLMKDFTGTIQEWTTLHQKELVGLERKFQEKAGTVENPSWKWAIDSQRFRIQVQIQNLNEITNAL